MNEGRRGPDDHRLDRLRDTWGGAVAGEAEIQPAYAGLVLERGDATAAPGLGHAAAGLPGDPLLEPRLALRELLPDPGAMRSLRVLLDTRLLVTDVSRLDDGQVVDLVSQQVAIGRLSLAIRGTPSGPALAARSGATAPEHSRQQAADTPLPAPPPPPEATEEHHVDVVVVNSDGVPLQGVSCCVTLPDGTVRSQATDREGFVRIAGIPRPGSCALDLRDVEGAAEGEGPGREGVTSTRAVRHGDRFRASGLAVDMAHLVVVPVVACLVRLERPQRARNGRMEDSVTLRWGSEGRSRTLRVADALADPELGGSWVMLRFQNIPEGVECLCQYEAAHQEIPPYPIFSGTAGEVE